MKRTHRLTFFSRDGAGRRMWGAVAAWGVALGCPVGGAHAADAPAPAQPAASAPGAARSDAAPPRFEVQANGEEVLDRQAKLIWRRCVEGMRWTGTTCWGVAARLDFAAAQAHAAKQAKESGKPWRLPHVPEMRLIVQKPAEPIITSGIDRGKRAAWVDPQWFPATPAEWHWTQSTTVLGGNVNIYNYANIISGTTPGTVNQLSPRTGWALNFATGEPGGDVSRQSTLVVRLVRGASL